MAEKKIFVFRVTRPIHVKNPRPKKVFLTFRQKSVFGLVFEHTCAYARWALMHHFLSVCLSVRNLTKIQTRQKVTG